MGSNPTLTAYSVRVWIVMTRKHKRTNVWRGVLKRKVGNHVERFECEHHHEARIEALVCAENAKARSLLS